MTIKIVDIEKLRKINMDDELIGCLMEHFLGGIPGFVGLTFRRK